MSGSSSSIDDSAKSADLICDRIHSLKVSTLAANAASKSLGVCLQELSNGLHTYGKAVATAAKKAHSPIPATLGACMKDLAVHLQKSGVIHQEVSKDIMQQMMPMLSLIHDTLLQKSTSLLHVLEKMVRARSPSPTIKLAKLLISVPSSQEKANAIQDILTRGPGICDEMDLLEESRVVMSRTCIERLVQSLGTWLDQREESAIELAYSMRNLTRMADLEAEFHCAQQAMEVEGLCTFVQEECNIGKKAGAMLRALLSDLACAENALANALGKASESVSGDDILLCSVSAFLREVSEQHRSMSVCFAADEKGLSLMNTESDAIGRACKGRVESVLKELRSRRKHKEASESISEESSHKSTLNVMLPVLSRVKGAENLRRSGMEASLRRMAASLLAVAQRVHDALDTMQMHMSLVKTKHKKQMEAKASKLSGPASRVEVEDHSEAQCMEDLDGVLVQRASGESSRRRHSHSDIDMPSHREDDENEDESRKESGEELLSSKRKEIKKKRRNTRRHSTGTRKPPKAAKQANRKDEKFQLKFGLHESETAITTFSCALVKSGLPLQGRMHLTRSYICFDSKLMQSSITIPFSDVFRLDTSTISRMLPSVLHVYITTQDDPFRFTSFMQMEAAVRSINELWTIYKALAKVLISPNSGRNSEHILPQPASEEPQSDSTVTLPTRIAADIPGPDIRHKDMTTVLDVEVDVPIGELMQILLDSGGSSLWRQFLERDGFLDNDLTEWIKGSDDAWKRKCNCNRPISAALSMFGASRVSLDSEHFCRRRDEHSYTIEISTKFSGIPYADVFSVHIDWDISAYTPQCRHSDSGDNDVKDCRVCCVVSRTSRLRMAVKTVFTGSTLLKGTIRKNVLKESKASGQCLHQLLRDLGHIVSKSFLEPNRPIAVPMTPQISSKASVEVSPPITVRAVPRSGFSVTFVVAAMVVALVAMLVARSLFSSGTEQREILLEDILRLLHERLQNRPE